MTLRCWFITSSYLRTFFLTSKFCCSTWVCALLIARVTIPASIGTSSGRLSRVSSVSSAAPLNRRINSSPRDRIQTAGPQPQVGEKVDVAAQHDVGTAAGHVGGDRDGAAAAGLGDDAGFLLVVLRVEHVVRDAPLLELP